MQTGSGSIEKNHLDTQLCENSLIIFREAAIFFLVNSPGRPFPYLPVCVCWIWCWTCSGCRWWAACARRSSYCSGRACEPGWFLYKGRRKKTFTLRNNTSHGPYSGRINYGPIKKAITNRYITWLYSQQFDSTYRLTEKVKNRGAPLLKIIKR